MAKRRIINTKFWSDNYITNLDPSEKLLFLYFLTNPYTNISGAYEISIRQIALDTGFDKEMVEKIIKRFSKDNKIYYLHGYVVIKNFIKHQEKNPKVRIGIENEAKNLPEDIKNIVYDSLSYLNLNSNLNSNSNLNLSSTDKKSDAKLISEVINSFKEINPSYQRWFANKTQRASVERLLELNGFEKLQKVIGILPKTNKMTYMPTITTPSQLEDKWASLESNLLKKKVASDEKNKSRIIIPE